MRDVVIEHLRKHGFKVITDVMTGQRVLALAKEKARLSAKKRRALETATIADESTNNATVVSSADGVKVQNNLETLAHNYKNRPNKTKGFITDLSRSLGLEQHEASHYGTFETRDGSLVTIRVSNHNARVSFFDENEEGNGISIVISSHRNKGLLNDGSAHIVEYFYPKQSLERSEVKPLVEIIKSVSETLNSGEFKDITGLAQRQEVNADTIREHRVYHGSGAHVRFFRTADGDAYGFTIGGEIYIDPRIARSDTAVHEYAHLWASALRAENKKEWKNVVDLMKGTSVWEEIKETYPELKTDDEIADEVIATYSGRRGAERLRKEMDKAMADGTASEKEAAVSALERVKQAIEKFWHAVADFLHIHYTSAEQVADQVMKDLLDGVDPREFGKEDKGKARYQFIGEQGAERADHAEEVTTRLDNLSVAREMEAAKKDAKTIKLATGWERGADGKWRYEIPDLKYYAKGDAGYKKARAQQPWSKELDTLSDRIFEGEELSAEEQKRFDELAKKEKDFKTAYLNREKPHLADWVEDDELFKAYPDLKTMSVLFTDQLPRNVLGSYNEIENLIEINSALDNDVASVMAHEIQHAIQSIEGFARGGNDAYIDKVKDYIGNTSFKEMENFANNIAKLRGLPTYRDWMDNLDDNSFHQLAELKNKYQKQKNKYHPFFYAYADMVGFNEQDKNTIKAEFDKTEDEIKKILKKIGGNVQRNSFDIYKSLSGEVEARNVEKRMGMTPEERRASLAADTEDVSREDQIFLLGEDGNAASEEEGDVNAIFNQKLSELTETNADNIVLSLGYPSAILQSAGVENKPMKLYGNKVMKKMRKHGFALEELRDLPRAVANPIAVFNNYGEDGNRSILTELHTANGNFLVTISLGKGKDDIDFNIVSSVFGKGEDNIVDWLNRGLATYINKKKALNYLHHSALRAVTSNSPRLSSAANVVRNFENPNIGNEYFRYDEALLQSTERITLPTSVQEQVEAMHLGDEVKIVADGSGFKGKKRKAKGFYNKQTGKITIILVRECFGYARRKFCCNG